MIQYVFVCLLVLVASNIWAEQGDLPIVSCGSEQPAHALQSNANDGLNNTQDKLNVENNEPCISGIEYKGDPLLKGIPDEAMLSVCALSAQSLVDAIVKEEAYECGYRWRTVQNIGDIEDSCLDSACGTNLMCREAAVKIMVEDHKRVLNGG